MSHPIILPIVTVQHDAPTVISEVDSGLIASEDIWVSCYKTGEPSVHGKVRVSLDEYDRSLVRFDARDGVDMSRSQSGRDKYTIACPALGIHPTDVCIPIKIIKNPQRSDPVKPHAITAFDVSPDGTQIATGYHDGSVHILPANTAEPSSSQLQRSKPHLSSVTALQFFPSSRVLLSGGIDFTLCILPAEPLSPSTTNPPAIVNPVRTLRGHTRPITSTSIVERGRNVLSAAKDGTIRLWDVSAGSQIRSMSSHGFCPISAIALGDRGESVFPGSDNTPEGPPSDLNEVGTTNQVIFAALEDGTFTAFDLRSGRSVFRSPARGPGLTAITYSPKDNMVATGSTNGVVSIWDNRSLDTHVTCFMRNSSGIEDVAFVNLNSQSVSTSGMQRHVGVVIATADALPYVASVQPEGPQVVAELLGADCERVAHIRVQGAGTWGGGNDSWLWTAADDGFVRRY